MTTPELDVPANFTKLMSLVLSKDYMSNHNFPVDEPNYVATEAPSDSNSHVVAVYAIDCEMVLTSAPESTEMPKHELARLSVLDIHGEVKLDVYIKPAHPVVDYLTPYSGITPEILKNVTLNLRDAQNKLKQLVTAHDFLIGHALENDLHALRLIHNRIIDTSVLYPRKRSPPTSPLFVNPALENKHALDDILNGSPTSAHSAPAYLRPQSFMLKRSLRELAYTYLKRNIQTGQNGHSSVEDAHAALDLVLRFFRCAPVVASNSSLLGNKSPIFTNPRINQLRPAPLLQTSSVQRQLRYPVQPTRTYISTTPPVAVPLRPHMRENSSPFPQSSRSSEAGSRRNRGGRRARRGSGSPGVKLFKTKPCKYFSKGNCKKGSYCTFRHDEKPMPSLTLGDSMIASETMVGC